MELAGAWWRLGSGISLLYFVALNSIFFCYCASCCARVVLLASCGYSLHPVDQAIPESQFCGVAHQFVCLIPEASSMRPEGPLSVDDVSSGHFGC